MAGRSNLRGCKAPKKSPAAPVLVGYGERNSTIEENEDATAARSSSAPCPPLHQHALLSIFKFVPLHPLCLLSAVSHDWQRAVRQTPLGAVWRRMAALDAGAREEICKAALAQNALKQVNDPARKEKLLRRWKKQLRQGNCMAVAGPLLSLMRSATVLRKDDSAEQNGSASLSLQFLTSASASSSSSSSSSKGAAAAAAAASAVRLQVSWSRVDDFYERRRTECQRIWIGHVQSESLMEFRTERSPHETHEREYNVAGLAELLRARGILLGSRRQQSELLSTAIQSLFALSSEHATFEFDESESVVCDAAVGYDRPRYGEESAAAGKGEAAEPPLTQSEGEEAAEEERQRVKRYARMRSPMSPAASPAP